MNKIKKIIKWSWDYLNKKKFEWALFLVATLLLTVASLALAGNPIETGLIISCVVIGSLAFIGAISVKLHIWYGIWLQNPIIVKNSPLYEDYKALDRGKYKKAYKASILKMYELTELKDAWIGTRDELQNYVESKGIEFVLPLTKVEEENLKLVSSNEALNAKYLEEKHSHINVKNALHKCEREFDIYRQGHALDLNQKDEAIIVDLTIEFDINGKTLVQEFKGAKKYLKINLLDYIKGIYKTGYKDVLVKIEKLPVQERLVYLENIFKD